MKVQTICCHLLVSEASVLISGDLTVHVWVRVCVSLCSDCMFGRLLVCQAETPVVVRVDGPVCVSFSLKGRGRIQEDFCQQQLSGTTPPVEALYVCA